MFEQNHFYKMFKFDMILDFDDYNDIALLKQTKYTKLTIGSRKSKSSQKYIFKTFNFICGSSKWQKIILETFYQINSLKCQYLQCYNSISFVSTKSTFQPTFSMKFISSNTLEHIIRSPNFPNEWKINDALRCLFSVAEGLSYLHQKLIYHGNLCPSNIVVDIAKQCYLCDFYLYPIKKLYINNVDICNKDYRDPSIGQNDPSFKNDVYSFGVLMCDLYLSIFKQNPNESLYEFVTKNDPNKFDKFHPFFKDLIPKCLLSSPENRPTFVQILSAFEKGSDGIDQLYKKFKETNYIVNLAKRNDPFALNKLGEMYENGKVFTKDHKKAFICYEKAAMQNNTEAQSNLGVLLQETEEKSQENLIKGANFLKQSADRGNIHGMANYGIALKNGDGVEKNIDLAKKYLKKSADLGLAYAQVNYGFILLESEKSINNVEEGLKYIKMAIDQSFPDAFYTYGILLSEGKYIDLNNKLAMEYFKAAADKGYMPAIMEYAEGQYYGKGVPKNDKEALKYFKMAASEGNDDAKKFVSFIKQKLIIENERSSSQQSDQSSEIVATTSPKKLKQQSIQQSIQSISNKSQQSSIQSCMQPSQNQNQQKQKQQKLQVVQPKQTIQKSQINQQQQQQQKHKYVQPILVPINQNQNIQQQPILIQPNLQTMNSANLNMQPQNDFVVLNPMPPPNQVVNNKGTTFTLPTISYNNYNYASQLQQPMVGLNAYQSQQIPKIPFESVGIYPSQSFNSIPIVGTRMANQTLNSNPNPKTNQNQKKEVELSSQELSLSSEQLIIKGDSYFDQKAYDKAYQYYKAAADKGDPNSYLKCASLCSEIGKKLDYYELAIQNKIPDSFSRWRNFMISQINNTRKREIGLKFAQRFEKNNDFVDAGYLYLRMSKLIDFAICYDKAKSNIDDIQDAQQQCLFGTLCEYCKDNKLAIQMFTKAVENGYTQAQVKIDKLKENVEEMPKNVKDELIAKGIDAFEGRNGTEIDYKAALECFKHASFIGSPKADFYIGKFHENGYGCVEVNLTSASNCYRISAQYGDPDGLNAYANCLMNGIGTSKNEGKAFQVLKYAVDKGNTEAAYNLGIELLKRAESKEKIDEAVSYIKKAAEKLYPDALFKYSTIIKDQNPEDAEKYRKFAIEKGSELALKENGNE